MSTLLISIDRTSLGKTPLVLSGTDDEHPIGITSYTEPTITPEVTYAPDSVFEDGSMAMSVRLPQTALEFSVCTTGAATEADLRAYIRELREAVFRLGYDTTVTVDGAPAETWSCTAGAVAPIGSRDSVNLEHHDPEWSVVIPAHPIPAIA